MATILDEEQAQAAPPVRMEISDGLAVIRLNDPARPVNVISEGLLREMGDLLDRLENGEGGVRAAVIISEKKGTWIAGADIEEFKNFQGPADAEAASRAGQELLNRIERLRIPVVAAIDGAALGGGLETALACTYRIATDSPKTKLGLPEVQLGIIPGAGGTARLPRLIGLRGALDLMLTGKQLDARRALKAGIVDEVVPAPILLEVAGRQAMALAARKLQPRAARPSGSPDRVENLLPMKRLIFSKARQGVMSKTHGLYPAPLRLLKVVERGIDKSVDEALDLEAKAFGELAVTPEARSLVHVFFTSTAAKNDPGLETPAKANPIDQVAIVGAGFMGAGIAATSAEAGIRVRLKDVKPEAAAKGLRTARESLAKRAKRKKMKRFQVTALTDRVQPTTEYTGFHASDIVVEAVFEDLDLKHRVIKEIEDAAGEGVVLGSNTSTIPITKLAEASARPDHVIGLHFFSPVEKMPLVEIITHAGTADWVTATAHGYAKKIGKTPIVVHDAPGFYVNRILSPYMAEAALLLQEGVRMEDIDRAMTDWGFPVGPITLYDEVGLDVAQKAGKIMAAAFSDRMGNPPTVVDRMVEDGRLGRKNGKGFYTFDGDGKKGGPDEAVYALIGNPSKKEMPKAEIQERLGLVMVNEAVRTLEEGVLRSARDGDVGAVFGIGFPPFRGGPFWFVDTEGAQSVLERLRALEARYGKRFAPAARLEEMARDKRRFFEDGDA
ncbi:3-hydroxyacyl-CoA dehydrogenase NAD-binding domain-containing protein [Longimicrobium sp.]|uniref:3-hydroxyacyl-CoA dehydrogenase NAD-binding domain-containing protein n=1 Tax=Longimicrobium sp. TaxID=2029185 RepID=UPI002E32F47E|nr:3-hydroxyacyl-CoA dehydrogenase NAD-binding domain-containing protein [Longimicrobium sp.]HEX6037981.1 3-hydroxyacyl-CoA dehydrogenase NAD-binding domain-containing protein [Longimicrobium sp.]